MSGTVYTAEL